MRGLRFVGLVLGVLVVGGVQAQEAESPLGKATIAGIEVSGLTAKEARQKLMAGLAPKLQATVTLSDGVKKTKRSRADLGVLPDVESMVAAAKAGAASVPLKLKVNVGTAQKALRTIATKWDKPGKNATIQERKGRLKFIEGQYARRVNVAQSAQNIAQTIEQNPAALRFNLVTEKKPPKVTKNSLKGITGRLSSFTTRFNPGSVKRTNNIIIAVKTIDGMLLPPTGVFSLNETVGERTQVRGYRTAPVIVDGRKVPGIGGGVSQVTGTLFNAALLAGLKIVEYRTHAKTVAYIPLGRDATVAWGRFDMKFKNNTDAPILIQYKIKGSALTAILYGKKTAGQKVGVKVNVLSRGVRSIRAELYRTIKQGNKIVAKEKIGISNYNWKPDENED